MTKFIIKNDGQSNKEEIIMAELELDGDGDLILTMDGKGLLIITKNKKLIFMNGAAHKEYGFEIQTTFDLRHLIDIGQVYRG